MKRLNLRPYSKILNTIVKIMLILEVTNVQQIVAYPRALNGLFDTAVNLAPQDACSVDEMNGFYVLDIVALIKNVANTADCTLLCMHETHCLSGNFVETLPRNLTFCYLQASNADSENSFEKRMFDASTYFDFRCDRKKLRKSIKVDAGEPPQTCGSPYWDIWQSHSFGRTKRLSGASVSEPYSQPWLGHLYYRNILNCGISLIIAAPHDVSTKWAITAAHCFHDHWIKSYEEKDYHVVFGVYDLRFNSAHYVRRQVKKISAHPGYYYPDLNKDLAIVEFAEKIYFNRYVSAICLPRPDLNYSDELLNAVCYVCGWGRSAEDVSLYADGRLRCLNTQVEDKNSVNFYHGDYKHMAVSRWPKRDCKHFDHGDSGSAAVCRLKNEQSYTLIGVVSAHSGTCNQEVALYAHVPKHISWIRAKIQAPFNLSCPLNCFT